MPIELFKEKTHLLKTRKTAGTAENPAHQETTFCDIQIKV